MQSHDLQIVYSQWFGAQVFLVVAWKTSKGWKSSIKTLSGYEPGSSINDWNCFWSKVLLSWLEASGIFNLLCLIFLFHDKSICSQLNKSRSIVKFAHQKKTVFVGALRKSLIWSKFNFNWDFRTFLSFLLSIYIVWLQFNFYVYYCNVALVLRYTQKSRFVSYVLWKKASLTLGNYL